MYRVAGLAWDAGALLLQVQLRIYMPRARRGCALRAWTLGGCEACRAWAASIGQVQVTKSWRKTEDVGECESSEVSVV